MCWRVSPDCLQCTRFHHADMDQDACDAVPSGIPSEIWGLRRDHREPFEGDGGLLLDPEPGFEPEDAASFRMKLLRARV